MIRQKSKQTKLHIDNETLVADNTVTTRSF